VEYIVESKYMPTFSQKQLIKFIVTRQNRIGLKAMSRVLQTPKGSTVSFPQQVFNSIQCKLRLSGSFQEGINSLRLSIGEMAAPD